MNQVHKLFIITAATAISFLSWSDISAQCNGRYLSEVFSSVDIDTSIQFGEAVNDTGLLMQLKMDVYEPNGDTEMNRPLLIFCHQGGFSMGTKSDSDMVLFCTEFAKMGYVTASIEYRLTDGANITDSVNMIKAVFRGVQDGKAAIRWFRKNVDIGGNTYNINSDGIFFGGSSAGSILSMHLVYMDDTASMSTNWQQYMDSLGGLEGSSGNPGYSTEVLACYNFAGTLADTNWLESGDPPLFSSHTVDDPLAIYGYGPPYGLNLLPSMYGSSLLHQRANNVGMGSTFYSYPGSQHPPYKNAPLFDTAIVHLRDFLYEYVPCNNVSIVEMDQKSSFSVYPNPITETATVKFDGNLNIREVNMFDILGENVAYYPVSGANQLVISTGTLKPGIYILQALSSDGMLAKKIVIR